MAKLTKKDLHPMILKRVQILTGRSDVKVGTIQSLIEEESGYVSREFLGTLLTSDKKMQVKTAAVLARFLRIDLAAIETHENENNFKPISDREKKPYAWEFSKQQQDLIDLSRLFFRVLT